VFHRVGVTGVVVLNVRILCRLFSCLVLKGVLEHRTYHSDAVTQIWDERDSFIQIQEQKEVEYRQLNNLAIHTTDTNLYKLQICILHTS
jgi:hypothetical protein